MPAERVKLWRTGRKVGRTIYEQQGAEPSDDDVLIGVMDTADLSGTAVHCRNFMAACPEGVTAVPIRTLNDMEARIRSEAERETVQRIVAFLRGVTLRYDPQAVAEAVDRKFGGEE